MTKVSVIIPTFNRLQFLVEAIDSVLVQSFSGFELIVVDDGSADGTGDVIPKKYPQIKFIKQQNRGVSAARNVGIKKSCGEFIAFLDSDDLWLPMKLQKQVAYLDANPNISICQTEEAWIRNGKRVNPAMKHKKHSGWIFNECVPLCIVSPSAVMIRRQVFDRIGLFDEVLLACEDYDLWLRASLHYQITTLPESLIVKRGGHADQLSKQWGLDRYRITALLKLIENEKLTDEQKNIVISNIKERCRILEAGFIKRNKFDEAGYYRDLFDRINRIIVDGA